MNNERPNINAYTRLAACLWFLSEAQVEDLAIFGEELACTKARASLTQGTKMWEH
jgi:hypothetical protein